MSHSNPKLQIVGGDRGRSFSENFEQKPFSFNRNTVSRTHHNKNRSKVVDGLTNESNDWTACFLSNALNQCTVIVSDFSKKDFFFSKT